MQKRARLAIPVLVAVALCAPLTAFAVVNPIIDFNPGNACEYANGVFRAFGDHDSNAGDTLEVYGVVVQFNDPFNDLDPNDPTQEYTYVISGISLGTVAVSTIRTTNYSNAKVQVYCDPNQNADPSDKSTYTDGTLILEGTFSSLQTLTRTNSNAGNIQHDGFVATGGTLASRLEGCTGVLVSGAFSVTAPVPPAGYFGTADTKLDVECPVPAEPSTWGKLKTRFD